MSVGELNGSFACAWAAEDAIHNASIVKERMVVSRALRNGISDLRSNISQFTPQPAPVKPAII
jgi:hypothetical protein